MSKVIRFLEENPVQYLSTIGLDGKPKCRPFMFCFEEEGKLWFCTNHTKEVYKELQKNPYTEVTVSNKKFEWIRLSGKAEFVNNKMVKKACMNIPIVKNIYQTPDNPIFEVFYLKEAKAVISDFSGNPPVEFLI